MRRVRDAALHGNYAVNNTGPILWADFLVPALLLALVAIRARATSPPAG
jgi:hypothetical protein